jgi:hypothetical protein
MSDGLLPGIIVGFVAMIFTFIIVAIMRNRREKLKFDEGSGHSIMENVGGKIIFYLMLIIWIGMSIPMIDMILGRTEYDILAPIAFIVIASLTILAYLWGYGFKIYYNGEEIIYKSVLRIKIQYYFTGYHYIMGDLKEKVPDYLWKDARIGIQR